MGHTVKTYLLVTEKAWHDELFSTLSNSSNAKWIRIKTREAFNREDIASLAPDKIFIPHWSHVIPADIYENFECIVFHMTDLPFGRGGSPLQNLIVRGFKETVISAIKVTKGLDTGDIYLKYPLSLEGSASDIFYRATGVIREMIVSIVEKDIRPVPQRGEIVEFKRRKPEESDISDLKEPGVVYDYIRMLDCEGYPHAYMESNFFKWFFIDRYTSNAEYIRSFMIFRFAGISTYGSLYHETIEDATPIPTSKSPILKFFNSSSVLNEGLSCLSCFTSSGVKYL